MDMTTKILHLISVLTKRLKNLNLDHCYLNVVKNWCSLLVEVSNVENNVSLTSILANHLMLGYKHDIGSE